MLINLKLMLKEMSSLEKESLNSINIKCLHSKIVCIFDGLPYCAKCFPI